MHATDTKALPRPRVEHQKPYITLWADPADRQRPHFEHVPEPFARGERVDQGAASIRKRAAVAMRAVQSLILPVAFLLTARTVVRHAL